MTREALHAQLTRWRQQGWLRALDVVFARFVETLDERAPDSLLWACACLSRAEGLGHVCLDLAAVQRESALLLGLPREAAGDFAAIPLPGGEDAARTQWSAAGALLQWGAGESSAAPLVMEGDRLYLRRNAVQELRVAREVALRVSETARPLLTAAQHAAARTVLHALFPAAAGPEALADEQFTACALALRRCLSLVTGGPGTGKTHTAARLLLLMLAVHGAGHGEAPLRVGLAAPTGKAAARLRQSIVHGLQQALPGLPHLLVDAGAVTALAPARTLHALLGARPGTRRFARHRARPLELDLLIVDEASMIHLELMDALLDALPATAHLVLLGDRDQLASVEAGSVMGDLCARAGGEPGDEARRWLLELSAQPAGARSDMGSKSAGEKPASALADQTVVLRRRWRFSGAIGEWAEAVNAGDTAAVASLRHAGEGSVRVMAGAAAAAGLPALVIDGPAPGVPGFAVYARQLATRPADREASVPWARQLIGSFERCRALCALREGPWGVAGLNALIERELAARGWIARRGEWYEGRPVIVTHNDPALGLFNGDIGLVLRMPDGASGEASALRACFAVGDDLKQVSVGRLPPVATAFAMTVHKSQGSEFGHVILVLPEEDSPVLTRELLYTGITRSREALTLVAPEPRLLELAATRATRRMSGLRVRLGSGNEA